SDAVAAGEDVSAKTDSDFRRAGPREAEPDVVDRAEDPIPLRERDGVCWRADYLTPLEIRLRGPIEKGRGAEAECPCLTHRQHNGDEGETRPCGARRAGARGKPS